MTGSWNSTRSSAFVIAIFHTLCKYPEAGLSDVTTVGLWTDYRAIAYQTWQPTLVTRRLWMHANRLVNSYVKWKIAINVTESEAVLILGKRKHI